MDSGCDGTITIHSALYISWSHFCNLTDKDFTSSRTVLVITKVAIVSNDVRAAFNPCALTAVSMPQFQLPPSDEDSSSG